MLTLLFNLKFARAVLVLLVLDLRGLYLIYLFFKASNIFFEVILRGLLVFEVLTLGRKRQKINLEFRATSFNNRSKLSSVTELFVRILSEK